MPVLQPPRRPADPARVRPWIVALLVAGTAVASVRHLTGHRHPVLIPLLLVSALVLGWTEWQFRADQRTFSTVASRIAERDVTIECQRFSGALTDVTGELGYVQFDAAGRPSDTGRLERTACNNLRDYLHGDKAQPSLEQVVAVQVLAHEAFHLAGVRTESETECRAMQWVDEVAAWLGASEAQGRALAERYARDVYPDMPAAYRSGDCVDGGSLDLAPEDPAWP